MVNKLLIVRIDSFVVQKVDLEIGDNIIGRGVATGHVDNQIADLAVTINLARNGEMTMTPMLTCYMKSSCSSRWQSLKIGCPVVIKSGDICSLLPDKSWFKVTTTNDDNVMEEDNDVNGKRKSANPSGEEPPDKKLRSEDTVETIHSQSRSVLDETEVVVHKEADKCHSNSTKDVFDSPTLRGTESSSAPNQSPSVEVITIDNNNSENAAADAPVEVSPSSVRKTTANDSPNTNEASSRNRDEAGKKIKWDCGRHFSDQTDQQTSDTTEDVGEASALAEENPVATDEASTDEPPRNKCTYGSQCYRRQSDHRTRFSHPGDPDYDIPDTRPECPYGVRCYRKNPQHKRDFKHTKRRRSRAQTPVRVMSGNEQSSAEESVDESEYEPSDYDGTSDDYLSELDDKSDFDGTSDCDDK